VRGRGTPNQGVDCVAVEVPSLPLLIFGFSKLLDPLTRAQELSVLWAHEIMIFPARWRSYCCHRYQRKPRENCVLKKAKSTFPARNTQASRLWRAADAICPSPVLQLMSICAKLGPNRLVIRWMSDECCWGWSLRSKWFSAHADPSWMGFGTLN
jgi:hypothetical protein